MASTFLRVYFSFVHFGQVSAALNKLGQHLNILSSRGFSGLSRGGAGGAEKGVGRDGSEEMQGGGA